MGTITVGRAAEFASPGQTRTVPLQGQRFMVATPARGKFGRVSQLIRRGVMNLVKKQLGLTDATPRSLRGRDPRGPIPKAGPPPGEDLWWPVQYAEPRTQSHYLARVLRDLVRTLHRTHAGHDHAIVALGPTLLGWYHVGAQLPWKNEIHVLVIGQHAQAAAPARWSRLPAEDGGDGAARWAVKAGPETVRVHVHVQRGDVDRARIRETVIDDATPICVPVDAKATLVAWYGATQADQLTLPGNWVWNAKSSRFVRVGTLTRALCRPIGVHNIKVTALSAAVLGVLYVVLIMLAEDIGWALDRKASTRWPAPSPAPPHPTPAAIRDG